MKVEELMTGDWYWWEAEGKKYPLQVTKDTFKLMDEDISNFQPIPITKEILEKNGFERENLITSYNHYIGIDNRVSLNDDFYCMNSRNMWTVHIDSEDYCTIANCGLTYLHELQHLLRLVKIDFNFVV